jgi:hypothetical protein
MESVRRTNDPGPILDAYRAGRPNLEGRVIFTNSRAGQEDAAFIKRNEPRGGNTAHARYGSAFVPRLPDGGTTRCKR